MSENGSNRVEHRAEPDVRGVVSETGQDPCNRNFSGLGQEVTVPVDIAEARGRNVWLF
jgi:hypothetical protein